MKTVYKSQYVARAPKETSVCSHLVELSLVCQTVDFPAVLVSARAYNLPSGRHVGVSLGSLVVRDDGVGEAPLPHLESEERLFRGTRGSPRTGCLLY